MNSGTELVLMHAITAVAVVFVYGAVFVYSRANELATINMDKVLAAYDLAKSMAPTAEGERIARSVIDTQAHGRVNIKRPNLLPFEGDILQKLTEIMTDLMAAMDSFFSASAWRAQPGDTGNSVGSPWTRTTLSSARTDSTRFLLGSPAISTGRQSPTVLQGAEDLRADTAMIQLCFVQLMTLLRVRTLPLTTAEQLVNELHNLFSEDKLRRLADEPYLRGSTLSLAGDAVFYLNCLLPVDTFVALAQLSAGGKPGTPEAHLFSVCAHQIGHFPECVTQMLKIASEPNLLALLALSLERVDLALEVTSQVGTHLETAIETHPEYAMVLGVAAHCLSAS